MAREFEYLATLTREYFLNGRSASRPPVELDWFRFIQLNLEQRVAGTLLPLIPRDDLDEITKKHLDETERMVGEESILRLLFLERIVPELEAAGCRPVILKGGALATHYYDRPEQRYLADLDILVERENVDRSCTVLKELGLHFTKTLADPKYYEDYHFHWIMDNGTGLVVEVHWDLTEPDSIYRFDTAGLIERSRTFPLNKTTMRIPSTIDLLLHIVTQCTAGGFGEMRRVIDAALLWQAVKSQDTLIKQAVAQNQGAALWLLLNQVVRWTDVLVPEDFLDRLSPGKHTARLLSGLAQRMVRGKSEFRHRGEIPFLLNWLCAPSPRLRRQEMLRYLSPGDGHWLESGFSREALPGFSVRIMARLSRVIMVLYLAGTTVMAFFRAQNHHVPPNHGTS